MISRRAATREADAEAARADRSGKAYEEADREHRAHKDASLYAFVNEQQRGDGQSASEPADRLTALREQRLPAAERPEHSPSDSRDRRRDQQDPQDHGHRVSGGQNRDQMAFRLQQTQTEHREQQQDAQRNTFPAHTGTSFVSVLSVTIIADSYCPCNRPPREEAEHGSSCF